MANHSPRASGRPTHGFRFVRKCGVVLPLCLSAVLMTACGGGGGGAPAGVAGKPDDEIPTPAPAGNSVAGLLMVDEMSYVDSDTNDSVQVGRADNGEFSSAQSLETPALVVGSVNEAKTGPIEGANYTKGDLLDVYQVSLKRGQVVELVFAADAASTDLDLYAANDAPEPALVGESVDTSQYECLLAGEDGVYHLGVYAYAGASAYNLRISNPTGGVSCTNVITQSPMAQEGQVVALSKPLKAAESRAQATRLQAAGVSARTVGAGAPALLTLPKRASAQATGVTSGTWRAQEASAGRLSKAMDTFAASILAKQLRNSGQYVYAEVNRWMQPLAAVGVGAFPPDDPFYARQQWHYDQINLPAAMARLNALNTTGLTRPVVAVIDSGVVGDHPDLSPNLIPGYSFISLQSPGDGNVPGGEDPSRQEDEPVFHGSHVAGTIGAATFNGLGGAGVAPMAQLMPLRVFAPRQRAALYDTVNAMLYAARLGNSSGTLPQRRADVINMSLGSSMTCPAAYQETVRQVRAQGVIVVAAAGNDARNHVGQAVPVGSPANCDGVISVGALGMERTLASFSQSGAKLKVTAPGGDLIFDHMERLVRMDQVLSTVAAFDASVRVPAMGDMPGTSMASPHVAGVVALMKFVYPEMTPAQFDAWLTQGKLTDDLGSPGWDSQFGYGLINARKAVDVASEAAGKPGTPPVGIVVANPASLELGATRGGMDFQLITTASTDEVVKSVVSSHPDVRVQRKSVDAATGLGTYSVTVDRSAWMPGTQVVMVTVTTSQRQFNVIVSASKAAVAGGFREGNLGPLYVLLLDTVEKSVVASKTVQPVNGRYTWSFSGLKSARVWVVAGGDLDNDGYICGNAEPCGGYPLLGAQMTEVDLSANHSNIHFVVAPLGGGDVSTAFTRDGKGLVTPIRVR